MSKQVRGNSLPCHERQMNPISMDRSVGDAAAASGR